MVFAMDKIKKNIVFILIVILIIIISIIFFLVYPKFNIKNYQKTINIEYGNSYNNNIKVCYGNKLKCKEIDPIISGQVDLEKLGKYEVKYTYKYKNKEKIINQIVNVIDTVSPNIELDESELWYCPNGKIPKFGFKATDNYDGNITSKVREEIKNDNIVFTVTDSSGNQTNLSKSAIKKDTEKPNIKLNGDEEVRLTVGERYEEMGAIAIDYCDGDLTDKIEISGSVDTNKPGSYILEYKVKDSNNNESTATRNITVINNNEIITPNGKTIYLTFDDGPSMYTNELLDILKKYDVKVTFFVTDQALTHGYDDVILRAYQEGHTIGLHSNSHNYSYIYSSVDNYFNDLYRIQEKVKRITGYTSTIIRFPGGSSNTVSKSYDGGIKIMSKLTDEVTLRGFRYFDWNVVSGDAGETYNTDKVISNVVNSLGNGSTYVVLQHDIKKFSVDAVEEIIKYGLSHGYQFRPLTMNSPRVEHGVNN